MSKSFSQADVASHNKPDNLYIIVDEDVYDLRKFQEEHPGGKKILQRVAGKDASKQFWKYHNEGILKKYKCQLQVGSINSKKQPAPPTPPPSPPAQNEVLKPAAESGHAAPMQGSAAAEVEEAEALDPYGDLVPYADPSWYQSVSCIIPMQPPVLN